MAQTTPSTPIRASAIELNEHGVPLLDGARVAGTGKPHDGRAKNMGCTNPSCGGTNSQCTNNGQCDGENSACTNNVTCQIF